MKTVKNLLTKEIKRVSDDKASEMIKKGWNYCLKEEWKTHFRPSSNSKTSEKAKTSEKGSKKKDKKKSGWKKTDHQKH